MELTTNADMQTLEMVKKGFINGVFKHPSFIVLHLERVFCGATINIVNINEDNFIVHCQSGKWEKNHTHECLNSHSIKENTTI